MLDRPEVCERLRERWLTPKMWHSSILETGSAGLEQQIQKSKLLTLGLACYSELLSSRQKEGSPALIPDWYLSTEKKAAGVKLSLRTRKFLNKLKGAVAKKKIAPLPVKKFFHLNLCFPKRNEASRSYARIPSTCCSTIIVSSRASISSPAFMFVLRPGIHSSTPPWYSHSMVSVRLIVGLMGSKLW